MRILAIFGPSASERNLRPFQGVVPLEWTFKPQQTVDAVLVFGGDGTVHRHLREIRDLNVPLLPVPTGSGNDFASSVGIKNPKTALHAWQKFANSQFNVRTIDLGAVKRLGSNSVTERLFCNVAYLGIDSDITRRANRLPRFLRANGGYIFSLFPALLTYSAPRLTVHMDDGRTIDEPVMLAVFANGSRYGRGLRIAPRADMGDGHFDLCFVRNLSKVKVAALFPIVYFGRHLGIREVRYLRLKQARIESVAPMDIYADGEYVCRTPAELEIIPQALKVIVP